MTAVNDHIYKLIHAQILSINSTKTQLIIHRISTPLGINATQYFSIYFLWCNGMWATTSQDGQRFWNFIWISTCHRHEPKSKSASSLKMCNSIFCWMINLKFLSTSRDSFCPLRKLSTYLWIILDIEVSMIWFGWFGFFV